MKRRIKRTTAFLAALLMMVSLLQRGGSAALKGVYFTAANDQLLALTGETMPFWMGSELYVCQTVFDGTDLGVRYVRNYGMDLAVLYSQKTDLRFDLVNQTIYDKNGVIHSGSAIEKNGYVFFPLETVCRYFGLKWSLSSTDTVPLVRVRSDNAMLDDRSFIAAAASMMATRYAEYERLVNSSQQEDTKPDEDGKTDPEPEKDPSVEQHPIHAEDGQKIYLIVSGTSEESLRGICSALGASHATFLLTAEQMENGDLIRVLTGSGHAVALMAQGKTEDEVREEILRARELVRLASCSLLQLVWYEGDADVTALLEEQGCVRVSADLDRRDTLLRTNNHVDALLRFIGQYREDMSVYLGSGDNCAEGMDKLLVRLSEAQYRLCAWRLTA